jgi:hypothetical protein
VGAPAPVACLHAKGEGLGQGNCFRA